MSANVPELRFSGFADPWEQRKLGELFVESDDRSSELEILSVSVRGGIYPASESDRTTNPGASIANYKVVHPGDIVYNSMRMWQGAVDSSIYRGIVSPAYVVARPMGGVDSRFFARLLKRPEMLSHYQRVSQGNSKDTLALKFEQFSQIDVSMPLFPREQMAIGELFDGLDSLIALHQRKHNQLSVLKGSLLEGMFPKPGSDVPELRFSGFADPWEQRKLGEVCTFDKGRGYSKADICESGTPLVLYGRLYTQYETVIESVDTYAESKDGSLYSRGGEVIVPGSGETAEDIAVASHISSSGILIGGDLNVITPQPALDSTFIAIGITNGSPHEQLAMKAQGKSVVHIHNDDIAGVVFSYPSLPEQRAVGALFSRLDSLIALHQRESPSVTYADD